MLFGRIGFYEELVYPLRLCWRMCGAVRIIFFIGAFVIFIRFIGLLSCRLGGGCCFALCSIFMVIRMMIIGEDLVFVYLKNFFVDCLTSSFKLSNHLRTFDNNF